MKIFTSGARCVGSQIERIEEGFLQLNHEIITDITLADLIYVNNAWYDDIIATKQSGKIKGKIVFTVLDLAPHVPDFPVQKLKEQLGYADYICTISKFVQQDLKNRTGFDSTVIYQPIKKVYRTGIKKHNFKAMLVGRVNDPAKKARESVMALMSAGFNGGDVVTVGREQPFYGGSWANSASDEFLNELYNSVDFVMCMSESEGMGLPALEAMSVGAIPVLPHNLTTREEFFPSQVFPEYTFIKDSESAKDFMLTLMQNKEKMIEMKNRLMKHFNENWSGKLGGMGVAGKILEVVK
jgi:glycosyltransferase involved in cell wall biosynthesis